MTLMTDTFSKLRRSQIMASIRSTGNVSTERSVAAALRKAGITGWRRHAPIVLRSGRKRKERARLSSKQFNPIPIRPDFVFRDRKVAVFVDGCFWHGCEKHSRVPKSNIEYWRLKIRRNRLRDSRTRRLLISEGWKVIRVWEHDAKSGLMRPLARIERALSLARVSNTR